MRREQASSRLGTLLAREESLQRGLPQIEVFQKALQAVQEGSTPQWPTSLSKDGRSLSEALDAKFNPATAKTQNEALTKRARIIETANRIAEQTLPAAEIALPRLQLGIVGSGIEVQAQTKRAVTSGKIGFALADRTYRDVGNMIVSRLRAVQKHTGQHSSSIATPVVEYGMFEGSGSVLAEHDLPQDSSSELVLSQPDPDIEVPASSAVGSRRGVVEKEAASPVRANEATNSNIPNGMDVFTLSDGSTTSGYGAYALHLISRGSEDYPVSSKYLEDQLKEAGSRTPLSIMLNTTVKKFLSNAGYEVVKNIPTRAERKQGAVTTVYLKETSGDAGILPSDAAELNSQGSADVENPILQNGLTEEQEGKVDVTDIVILSVPSHKGFDTNRIDAQRVDIVSEREEVKPVQNITPVDADNVFMFLNRNNKIFTRYNQDPPSIRLVGLIKSAINDSDVPTSKEPLAISHARSMVAIHNVVMSDDYGIEYGAQDKMMQDFFDYMTELSLSPLLSEAARIATQEIEKYEKQHVGGENNNLNGTIDLRNVGHIGAQNGNGHSEARQFNGHEALFEVVPFSTREAVLAAGVFQSNKDMIEKAGMKGISKEVIDDLANQAPEADDLGREMTVFEERLLVLERLKEFFAKSPDEIRAAIKEMPEGMRDVISYAWGLDGKKILTKLITVARNERTEYENAHPGNLGRKLTPSSYNGK